MNLKNNTVLWIFAIVLMIALASYQRMTGPTHPKKGKVNIENQVIKYNLPRSTDESGVGLIKIEVPYKSIKGQITLKRFKSHDKYKTYDLRREGDLLVGDIPWQPAAGKVEYSIDLISSTGAKATLTSEPIVIRFKGVVPLLILIPHILIMFIAMIFTTRAGFEDLIKGMNTYKYALWGTILFLVGGFVLGPLVQKYAFGAYWTGFPFGMDLTDNKTSVAMIMWIIALFKLKKNPNAKGWALAAALVMIAVYLVPHSVLGSEIDHTKLPQ